MNNKGKNTQSRLVNIITKVLFSALVGFIFSFGQFLDKTDNINLKNGSMWIMLAIIFSVVLLISIVVSLVFEKNKFRFEVDCSPKTKKVIGILVIILPAVMWIMAWLSTFPGVFSYDSFEEWSMVANGSITTHHPLIHVLFLGGLTQLSVLLTGSGNLGIAIYVLIQLLFAIYVMHRVYSYISAKTNNLIVLLVTLFFYTLSPVIQLYVISTTKDSIFALFELYFIISSLRMLEKEKLTKAEWAEYCISLAGTILFRKNGIFIVFASMITMIIAIKSLRKSMLRVLIVSIILFALYSIIPTSIFGVGKTESAEMLSIPIQQLARTYTLDSYELTTEEKASISEYFYEGFLEKYIPTTADAVKNGFNEEKFKQNTVGFAKIWIKTGVKHPMTYVNAFLVNTVDLWYPLAVNDGYRWLYGQDEYKSDYFDYRVAEPGEKIVIIKPLDSFYEYISTDKKVLSEFIPSLFLDPGWYILLWIGLLLYSVKVGDKRKLCFNVIMGMSLLTVLAGPMSMVRYVLIYYMVLPVEVLLFGRDY